MSKAEKKWIEHLAIDMWESYNFMKLKIIKECPSKCLMWVETYNFP